MTKPETLLRSLTSHLGIEYVLHIHTDRAGDHHREHHLYCDEDVIQQALRWSLKWDGKERVRIFEGDPPPF